MFLSEQNFTFINIYFIQFLKPPQIDYEPRNKAKGKGGSVKMAKNKKIIKAESKRKFIETMNDVKKNITTNDNNKTRKKKDAPKILDRFLKKK